MIRIFPLSLYIKMCTSDPESFFIDVKENRWIFGLLLKQSDRASHVNVFQYECQLYSQLHLPRTIQCQLLLTMLSLQLQLVP